MTEKVRHLMYSPKTTLTALVITMLGFYFAFTAKNEASTAADRQAEFATVQAAKQQQAFCGLVEAVGYPPPAAGEPSNPYARNFQLNAQRAAKVLGCTPDRTDNQ